MSPRLITAKVIFTGAAFAAAALITATANAAPTAVRPSSTQGERPQSTLRLSVNEGGHTRTAVLNCEPASGTHPYARQACDELQAADGRLKQLDQVGATSSRLECTRESRPVIATAQGNWGGRSVQFNASLPSHCALQAKTGTLFRF